MLISSGETMEAVKNFDNFITLNYDKLYTHALVTAKNHEDAHDLLMNTYIKVKEFIILSGYTTTRFITHFCKSITNTYIDIKRKKRINYVSENALESEIYDDEYMEREMQTQKREHLCKRIFQYIEQKYDPKECYVFRVYYLYPPNERMTYAKISKQTGMSITYCSETIKKIRLDIYKNFK